MLLTAKPICFPLAVPMKCFCNSTFTITPTITRITTTLSQLNPNPKKSKPSTLKKRKRYRKLYPGETTGITEEMRFVAMRLRNTTASQDQSHSDTWQPSIEGFLCFLVDSHLIFATLQRLVDESDNVSC